LNELNKRRPQARPGWLAEQSPGQSANSAGQVAQPNQQASKPILCSQPPTCPTLPAARTFKLSQPNQDKGGRHETSAEMEPIRPLGSHLSCALVPSGAPAN